MSKIKATAVSVLKNYLKGTQKAANIVRKAGDMRLNRSGTVGTEPVTNKKGQRTTEVKLGRVGSFQLPVIPRTHKRKRP